MNETIITNNIFKKSISKKLEWDLNVPDSKGDVLKILSSYSECFITDYSFNSDSCNLKLEAISKILYIPEDASSENICVLETKENFTMDADIPTGLSWDNEDIHIKCFNEPCILINSRKLGVRLNVTALIDLYSNTNLNDFMENEDICCQKKELYSTCIHGIKNEKISISPVFSLPSGKPAINEVIMLDITLPENDLKPITNKAVFKGNICAELLYISDISTVESVRFETPFTEIIDINGIDDKMTLMYNADVKKGSCDIIRGDGASGNGVTVNGVIELRIKACTRNNICYVNDAYSPYYKEDINKTTFNTPLFSDIFTDSVSIKELLEFEDTVISEVYWVKAEAMTRNAQLENGKIAMSCVLMCKVLYRTQSGIRCETKNINFDYAQPIKSDCNYENIDIMCKCENLSYVIAGNNMLEIRCNVRLSSYLSQMNEITSVVSVTLDKDSPKKLNRAPVVAYYPSNDEDVFMVAKKYLTTPDKIRELNSFSGDFLKKGNCVIIE